MEISRLQAIITFVTQSDHSRVRDDFAAPCTCRSGLAAILGRIPNSLEGRRKFRTRTDLLRVSLELVEGGSTSTSVTHYGNRTVILGHYDLSQ